MVLKIFRSKAKRLRKAIRPITWEDDFSRNTLDDLPFENAPSIQEFGVQQVQNVGSTMMGDALPEPEALQKFMRNDKYPIPATGDREGYCSDNHVAFWISGLKDYLRIQQVLAGYDFKPSRVFEFGCASGRVLRHLASHDTYDEIWASDINYRHIRWVNKFLPQSIQAFHNHVFPSLPIADGALDLVSAFSVFTHIDTFETAWVAEIFRVLRSGGMAYITAHTEHTWKAWKNESKNAPHIRSIRKHKYYRSVDEEMPVDRMSFRMSEIGPYRCNVFHSVRYISDIWGRFFEILDIMPMHHGKDQTVLVLRKP